MFADMGFSGNSGTGGYNANCPKLYRVSGGSGGGPDPVCAARTWPPTPQAAPPPVRGEEGGEREVEAEGGEGKGKEGRGEQGGGDGDGEGVGDSRGGEGGREGEGRRTRRRPRVNREEGCAPVVLKHLADTSLHSIGNQCLDLSRILRLN
jgi:hypothetical protein